MKEIINLRNGQESIQLDEKGRGEGGDGGPPHDTDFRTAAVRIQPCKGQFLFNSCGRTGPGLLSHVWLRLNLAGFLSEVCLCASFPDHQEISG